ncbi:MAG: phytoene desaturase family protein [Planctomycetota bacterium]|jgi:phytoene desaturase
MTLNRVSRDNPIGVVGAGLGGLAAACTLAARGHRVILFEANPWAGGKAAVWEPDGFRFDMGPTILTLPSVLRRVFAEADRDLSDYLDLVPLDPQWRCFFEDGTTLDLEADVERMAQACERFAPGRGVGDGYRRLLRESQGLNELSQKYFFYRSVGSLGEVMRPNGRFTARALWDLLRLRPGQSVGGRIRAHISDARVAQMLDHFTQYVGSAPDASPAVLAGIAHMQTAEGVWYPMGGIGAVPEALRRLAAELGVEMRFGTGIRRILVRGGRVEGVLTHRGTTVALSAVVSNADAVRTHRELLGDDRAARRFERRRRYEAACSGVVAYLGLRERYDHLLHHDFVFSRDPHEEFQAIYRRGEPAPDPTVYLCAPAATDPAVAPPGGEALYLLAHTPYLRPGHDWAAMLPDYRRVMLDKLARTAGLTDLKDRIVTERWLTPQDIHDRYRVLNGAIYGIASHGRFLGALKPANRSPDVAGLYCAGGAAHPGPGMPMVLMSGWIAGDACDADAPAAAGRARRSAVTRAGA